MPPKTKFTTDRIIEAAYNVVRKKGWENLSARSIAKELSSSTNPVYFHLKSMENLKSAVMKKGIDLCLQYVKKDRTGDRWVDQGVGYVLFARDEKRLFRSINDEKYQSLRAGYEQNFWKELDDDIKDYPLFFGLPDQLQEKIRRARSIFSYGMATMISGTIEYDMMKTEEQIIDLMRVASFSFFNEMKKEYERK